MGLGSWGTWPWRVGSDFLKDLDSVTAAQKSQSSLEEAWAVEDALSIDRENN